MRLCSSSFARMMLFSAAAFSCALPTSGLAQSKGSQPAAGVGAAAQSTTDKIQKAVTPASGLGQKNSPSGNQTGTDKTSASKPAVAGEDAASTEKLKLGPLDPSTKPTGLPHNRPVIGLAMGGGAALGLSEIGTLVWLEEHHIPIDVISGTSMGSILAALYSTGHTPEQLKHLLNEKSVGRVFTLGADYASLNYRRREDDREIPSGIGVGLKHGVSFRNSILTDTGLNELLDKEFIRYNDQTDFNNLPIPFRCQATDLTAAKTVTFSRGSLQDAVRASASIPGVFRPFELDGHEFVDGAILENLPTADVKAMGADVVIAISLPLGKLGTGDLDSILGVLQRAFAVGIETNEVRDRKLANVVIMPDIKGFGANDYLKTDDLTKRGYDAAEAHKDELLKYSISTAEWAAYIANRNSKLRPAPTTVLQVKVKAPNQQVAAVVHTKFQSIVGQPVDTDQVEALLADVRSDGRYDADYTVGYDNKTPDNSQKPIILVAVKDKKTGPPFLDIGLDLQAQTGGITRATLATLFRYQDLGGYGSGLRGKVDLGFLTKAEAEYYWKPRPLGHYFIAPRVGLVRQPYYIYGSSTQGDKGSTSGYRISERQSQFAGVAADVGATDGKFQELRAGIDFEHVTWNATTGSDGLPDYNSNSQLARVRYVYDNQDRALVPRFGERIVVNAGYLYGTAGSPSAPKMTAQFEVAHTLAQKNTILVNFEGGTMFNRPVVQPFRFTLGGPLRLGASAIDEYRGTDYFLITPGYLRRIFALPAPLSSSVYFGGAYEVGQMRAPEYGSLLRQDVYFGLIAETPLGVITAGPAIGDHDERKFVFTLGRFF